MDFKTKKNRGRLLNQIQNDNLASQYPHNVMLYYLPPVQDITLPVFEELAIERLNVLRILEQASSKNLRILSDEWRSEIIAELNHAGLKHYVRLIEARTTTEATMEQDLIARRKDYISHFILRLAYCRSQDLRNWFKTRELELFKLKFQKLTELQIVEFLSVNKLNYQPISEEEKENLRGELFNAKNFYRVHFTEVPELIRYRKCYLSGGFAYVDAQDFITIITGIQEKCIEDGLLAASKMLPEIENDERIVDLLKRLHTSYTGKDYALGSKDNVPIECIDQLSKKSFPLCMRQCHETLRTKHHLKHFGRLQYGLFLKGIGVSLEDSMKFWREEFTKLMDLDRFERNYAYGVRYNYGKEGSQRNWAPHSCLKIISEHVGPLDAHGCPFKTLDANSLRARLNTYGIGSGQAQEIVSYATKGHYQIACAKYFQAAHETDLLEGITHPNQFFEKSQEIMLERSGDPNETKSAKLNKSRANAVQNKNPLFDEYDDDLWNATAHVESNTQTTQWKDDSEFDESMSQLVDY